MPNIFQREVFISGKGQYPPRSPNNNLWAFVFQQVLVNFDINTTIKNSNLYIRQVSTKPLELVTDLQVVERKYEKHSNAINNIYQK